MIERLWPTHSELEDFRQRRKLGLLTFFRTASCEGCKGEIPKGMKYCSERCKKLARTRQLLREINELTKKR